MSDLEKAQKKLAALQSQLEAEQTKRQGIESELAGLRETMGKLVASGKRTASDVTDELTRKTLAIEVGQELERTLAVSIQEAKQAVTDARIVDFRGQAAAKEKELEKHEAEVAKLLKPILANEILAGLVVSNGKGQTAKARELMAAIGNLSDNARRLELGMPPQPNIYEGLPDGHPRARTGPAWVPLPNVMTNVPG